MYMCHGARVCKERLITVSYRQWRTQEFFSGGGGSTNSVEDRENGDLGTVAP